MANPNQSSLIATPFSSVPFGRNFLNSGVLLVTIRAVYGRQPPTIVTYIEGSTHLQEVHNPLLQRHQLDSLHVVPYTAEYARHCERSLP